MGSYGPPPKQFLHFRKLERNPGAKTDRYSVASHHGAYLGIIRFYPQWRCYVCEPGDNTVWSWDCCKEMSEFLKKITDEWRASKRKAVK